MATKRPPESSGSTSNKKAKPSVPAILWSKYGNRLKWALLTEAEKPENIVVPTGPKKGQVRIFKIHIESIGLFKMFMKIAAGHDDGKKQKM